MKICVPNIFINLKVRQKVKPGGFYDIHPFEQGGKIYKRFGVEQFLWLYKRIPILGSYKRRIYDIINLPGSTREERIDYFISQSIVDEKFHYLGLTMFVGMHSYYRSLPANIHMYFLFLNIVVNLYPIMLQRYKRARLSLYYEKYKSKYKK